MPEGMGDLTGSAAGASVIATIFRLSIHQMYVVPGATLSFFLGPKRFNSCKTYYENFWHFWFHAELVTGNQLPAKSDHKRRTRIDPAAPVLINPKSCSTSWWAALEHCGRRPQE